MPNARHARSIVADRRATAHCAISRRRDGATIFCQRLGDDLGLQTLFGIHFLQAPVLILELLRACHERRAHATVLGAPFVEERNAGPAQGRNSLHRLGETDSSALKAY